MKKITLFLFVLFAISSFTTAQELEAVESVDLTQYAGKWYEIASFPQPFQKGCFCTTAEYTVSDKGYIVVENTCNKDSVTGKISYIKGKAQGCRGATLRAPRRPPRQAPPVFCFCFLFSVADVFGTLGITRKFNIMHEMQNMQKQQSLF